MVNIFWGVLSGVITSAILFLLFLLKEKVFNPWLENRLYKGVMLDGSWTGKRSRSLASVNPKTASTHELNIQMDLKQSGYKIQGIFSADSGITIQKDKTRQYSNVYRIHGHIQDNFVVLEYYPFSRKRVGIGTFLLEVREGGKKLVGHATFVSEGAMNIETMQDITLDRVSEN